MPKASTAPKNPEVVHINGRLLYQSCQRNIDGILALSATAIVITLWLYEINVIVGLGFLFLGLTLPLVIFGMALRYLLKICFIDGAMGSLIIRGNKGQPVNL